jgi:RNA polymerase primary sigma factor
VPLHRAGGRLCADSRQLGSDRFEESSLDQYLKEISAYPLLKERTRSSSPVRIRGKEEALDKLVRSNLRFVVSVAKKYQNQGVALGDLINEGNLGLIRAAHKFDETKGIKFISYAVWWIRQAILQALAEQSRIVRVSAQPGGRTAPHRPRSSTLLQELGREPTVEEIADELDLSEDEVQRTLAISQTHLSLDAPLTPGEDNRLLDYLPDQFSSGPDDETYERALASTIEEALGTLKEREARVLRLYFGLEDGQDPMTLEEIGALLGITRERVRQIKEKALIRPPRVPRTLPRDLHGPVNSPPLH